MLDRFIKGLAIWLLAALIYGVDLVVAFGTFFMTARETTTANELIWGSILLGEPIVFVLLFFRPKAAGFLLAAVATLSGLVALYSCFKGGPRFGFWGTIEEVAWFGLAFWGPKFLVAGFLMRSKRAAV